MNISRRDYDRRVEDLLSLNPYLRRGQAMMIILGEVRPSLYKMLTGTKWDAFYRNDRISELNSQLNLMWDYTSEGERGNNDYDDDDDEITINLNLSWPFL
jgi:hypothetical protein